MTLPYVNQTIRDGASGALALGSDLHVKIGVASAGDELTPTIYVDPDLLVTNHGVGPLVTAAAHHLAVTGRPVMVVRIASAAVTAGTISAITAVGGHAGPSVTDNSSAPLDDYQLLVEIVVGGALATATFRYSLDDGESWSAAIATAATVTLTGTGISLAFAAGTYVAGHQYSARTFGPTYSALGLSDAIEAALQSVSAFRLIHIVGYTDDATDMGTVAVAVNTQLEAAATSLHRYTRAIIEAADDVDADLVTQSQALSLRRVGIVAGFADVLNALTQTFARKPAAWLFVDRVMSVRISRDPGAVADGALAGVRSIERDEFRTPGLDDARYNTLRTWVGRVGHFITRGRLMAAPGSDFTSICRGFVMDAACAVAYDSLVTFVNDSVTVDATNGRISEASAQAIEAFVTARLRDALVDPGDAQDVAFIVDRTSNVLTTELLRGKTRVLPISYVRYIENELSFRNPALETTEA